MGPRHGILPEMGTHYLTGVATLVPGGAGLATAGEPGTLPDGGPGIAPGELDTTCESGMGPGSMLPEYAPPSQPQAS